MRNLLQWLVLPATLLLIIQGTPFLKQLGWTLLFVICAASTELTIYAAFFFSSFFISSGFLPNPFFTVKHFHVIVAFFALVQLVKQKLFSEISENIKVVWALLYWLPILMISTFSSFFEPDTGRALMTNANILSLIVSSVLLVGPLCTKLTFENALLFMGMGVSIHIILSGLTLLNTGGFYFPVPLPYNNHVGFLTSSLFFMILPLFFVKNNLPRKIACLAILLIMFFGLVFIRSRSGWFSFLLCFILFIYLFFHCSFGQDNAWMMKTGKRFFSIISVTFTLIFILLLIVNPDILIRVIYLKFLVDPQYLQFTLRDHQNFGFLGISRLNQFPVFLEIVKVHWLIGIGFARKVTDLHSLYLMILAGSGVVGLFCFAAFCVAWIKPLLRSIYHEDDSLNVFRIGVVSFFSVWLLYSFMEAFILQFHIWMILMIGALLGQKAVRQKIVA